MRPSLSTVILGCSAPAPRVSWLFARSFLHNAPAFMSLCNKNVAIVGSASATPPRRAVAPKAILARRRGFIWWSPTERGFGAVVCSRHADVSKLLHSMILHGYMCLPVSYTHLTLPTSD